MKGITMLKKTAIAGLLAAALGSGLAQAQAPAPAQAPAEPASPHTLTGNVGLYSQYIFRGLTQTNRDPAIQGGFDYSHSSGWYAGTWASNISWLRDNTFNIYTGGGSLEWDFYGGYKWGFAPDWTLDLGTLYYWYPGTVAAGSIKGNTWEVYGALGWKWLSAKYSYAISNDVFTVKDADGSWYFDLSANVPLGDYSKDLTGWTLMAHWGYQKFTGTDPRNPVVSGRRLDNDFIGTYKDWKIGLSYALPKDFTIGAYYTKAYDANVLGYGATTEIGAGGNTGPYPRNIAKGTGTIYIQKTF